VAWRRRRIGNGADSQRRLIGIADTIFVFSYASRRAESHRCHYTFHDSCGERGDGDTREIKIAGGSGIHRRFGFCGAGHRSQAAEGTLEADSICLAIPVRTLAGAGLSFLVGLPVLAGIGVEAR
jgi:hypothetical protein